MYGRLHQRKLKQDDYIMSCQKARRQLDSYIDEQAKRVNIDSAKKRAVLQHMDYDGFRQMVLGANIFPTKTTELQKFTKGETSEIIQNKLFLDNPPNQTQTTPKIHSVEVVTQVQGKSQLLCNSFREFKKKFMQNYPKNSQFLSTSAQALYTLLKNQDQNRIAKIFNMECEANILVKIVDLFDFIGTYLKQNDNEGKVVKEVAFQVKFLQTVLKLKTMKEFSLSILSKKQRTRIIDFLNQTKKLMASEVKPENQQNSENQLQNTEPKSQKIVNEDEKTFDELIAILSKK